MLEALIVENSGLKHISKHDKITDEQMYAHVIFFGMKAFGTLVYSLTQPYYGREGISLPQWK
jgi:hypothetical protein